MVFPGICILNLLNMCKSNSFIIPIFNRRFKDLHNFPFVSICSGWGILHNMSNKFNDLIRIHNPTISRNIT